MGEFRFKDFPVYIKAQELYKIVIELTNECAEYYLKDQVRRASLSIILNIAEGSAKKSDKDFARYIQNALGSVSELYAAIDTMSYIGIISESDRERISEYTGEIARQLGGLHKKLVNSH